MECSIFPYSSNLTSPQSSMDFSLCCCCLSVSPKPPDSFWICAATQLAHFSSGWPNLHAEKFQLPIDILALFFPTTASSSHNSTRSWMDGCQIKGKIDGIGQMFTRPKGCWHFESLTWKVQRQTFIEVGDPAAAAARVFLRSYAACQSRSHRTGKWYAVSRRHRGPHCVAVWINDEDNWQKSKRAVSHLFRRINMQICDTRRPYQKSIWIWFSSGALQFKRSPRAPRSSWINVYIKYKDLPGCRFDCFDAGIFTWKWGRGKWLFWFEGIESAMGRIRSLGDFKKDATIRSFCWFSSGVLLGQIILGSQFGFVNWWIS